MYLFRFLFGDQCQASGGVAVFKMSFPPERNSILVTSAFPEPLKRALRRRTILEVFYSLTRSGRHNGGGRTYHFLVRLGSVLILIRDSPSRTTFQALPLTHLSHTLCGVCALIHLTIVFYYRLKYRSSIVSFIFYYINWTMPVFGGKFLAEIIPNGF